MATSDNSIQVDTDLVTEVAPDRDLRKAVKEEAFFNEPVTVLLHATTDDNAPPHIILSVNGRTQPVARGVPTTIRRMFVEVLARCWETRYSQPQRDLSNAEAGNQLIGRSALSYPFDVIEDKNPLGRAWLNKLRAEPA